MEGSDALLPFVSQFYGSPSTYLWEDEEGGERGRRARRRSHAGIILLGAPRCIGGHPSQIEAIGAVDGIPGRHLVCQFS